MSDDDILRRYYGDQPADYGPEGDRNSLGYALQGPAPPVTTADDLRVMGYQKAEKDRAGPEAAARLATLPLTAMTGIGAGAARRAPIPSLQDESMVDQARRYIDAMRLHQRGQVKQGNPYSYLEGLGVFGGATTATMAAALTGHPDLAALAASAAFLTRPRGVFMSGHTEDTANIAQRLRAIQQREAAAMPRNNGDAPPPPTNLPYSWRAQADEIGARPAERAGATEAEVPAQAAMDMSQAARSARAREAGFGPEIYYQGRESRYPGDRDVQYVTPSPRAASMFADSSLAQKGVDGGHVIPMLVKQDGFANLANEQHREAIAAQMARVLTEARPAHYEPVTTADAHRMLNEGITNGRAHWQNDTIINAAKAAGFKGIPVHENWAQWGWPDAHSLAVFDRSHLRSPHAEFANTASDDLLAARVVHLPSAPQRQDDPDLSLLRRYYGDKP